MTFQFKPIYFERTETQENHLKTGAVTQKYQLPFLNVYIVIWLFLKNPVIFRKGTVSFHYLFDLFPGHSVCLFLYSFFLILHVHFSFKCIPLMSKGNTFIWCHSEKGRKLFNLVCTDFEM